MTIGTSGKAFKNWSYYRVEEEVLMAVNGCCNTNASYVALLCPAEINSRFQIRFDNATRAASQAGRDFTSE